MELFAVKMHTHSTQGKFTHDPSPPPRLITTIFDRRRTRVFSKGVELELGLVANLSRQRLVPRHVEVGSASKFVNSNTIARLYVTNDPRITVGGHSGRWRREKEGRAKHNQCAKLARPGPDQRDIYPHHDEQSASRHLLLRFEIRLSLELCTLAMGRTLNLLWSHFF